MFEHNINEKYYQFNLKTKQIMGQTQIYVLGKNQDNPENNIYNKKDIV